MTLLTPEITAWVGQSIEFFSEPVTEGEIRRFVAASEDPNPAYLASGDQPPVQAPPMLYYAITRPFVAGSEFAEDGTVLEHRPMIGKGQAMGGSVEVEWLRPIRLEDRLRGVRTLASLKEKQGSRMHFVIAEWVTEYFDEKEDLVVRERYEQILF